MPATTLKTLCYRKQASHKRTNAVGPRLQEQAGLWTQEAEGQLPGPKGNWEPGVRV